MSADTSNSGTDNEPVDPMEKSQSELSQQNKDLKDTTDVSQEKESPAFETRSDKDTVQHDPMEVEDSKLRQHTEELKETCDVSGSLFSSSNTETDALQESTVGGPGSKPTQQTEDFKVPADVFQSQEQEFPGTSIDVDAIPLDPRDVSRSDQSQQLEELKEPANVSPEQEMSSTATNTTEEAISLEPEETSESEQEQNLKDLKEPDQRLESSESGDTPQDRSHISLEESQTLYNRQQDSTETIPKEYLVEPKSKDIRTAHVQQAESQQHETIPKYYCQEQNPGSETEDHIPDNTQLMQSRHASREQDLGTPGTERRAESPVLRSRIQHAERQNITSQNSQQIALMSPNPAWALDKLLADLHKEITSAEELAMLKDRFDSDFGKRVLEGITEPRKLFRIMKERCIITTNNIVYLQAVLLDLRRRELLEITIDYCQRSGNVLHFQPATEQPVNGYRYVKVHLYLDKEYNRKALADLQDTVARILCVPVQFVFIAGVEPSSSLLVTFMIPEMYANILVKYLDQNYLQHRFAAMAIDRITIEGKIYTIEATEDQGTKKSDEQLVSLYHQLSNKTIQLDMMEEKCQQLEEKIEDLELQVETKTTLIEKLEEKCQQLEDITEDLENQWTTEKALIEKMEEKYKQLEDITEALEKQIVSSKNQLTTKTTQLEQMEQNCQQQQPENEFLKEEIEYLKKSTESLRDKMSEKDEQIANLEEQMEMIETSHVDYMDILMKIVTQLQNDIKEEAVREPPLNPKRMPIELLVKRDKEKNWYKTVCKLNGELHCFKEKQNQNTYHYNAVRTI